MNGLGIAEIKLSEVLENSLKRLEAEFYIAFSHSKGKFVLGNDAIEFVQYGTSEGLNEEGRGYPVLRLNEFESIFIKEPSKYCEKIDDATYESLKLKAGDVLICRTNGNPKLVGKSAIVPKDTDFAFASYVFRIRPKREVINPETLTVYLNSKIGRAEIEKYSMVSNQANFSPAKFREIQIPLFNLEFQTRIEKLVKAAHEKLEQSKRLYAEAESLLLGELGLRDWQPTNENVAVKSFKESFLGTGRLDAEYFNPDKEKMLGRLEKFAGNTVGNYVSSINDTIDSTKGISNQLVRNFDLDDALQIFLDEKELMPITELGSTKKKIKKGDLVVSRLRSYLKEIAVVDAPENVDCVGSSEFIVLRPDNSLINAETLLVYLRSLPVQQILKWCQSGSNHPRFMQEDLLAINLPDCVLAMKDYIQTIVRNSIAKNRESKRLLELAKRGVEAAIERDEQAALEYLNKSVNY